LYQRSSFFTFSIGTPLLVPDFFILAIVPKLGFEYEAFGPLETGAASVDWHQAVVRAEKPIAVAQRAVRNTLRIEASN
jgi:hypothetical protein